MTAVPILEVTVQDEQPRAFPGTVGPRPAVTVEQLRTAWGLIADGWVGPPAVPWRPVEPVITVRGCHGGAGASLLAVAIATASSEAPARVLECAGPAHAGLAGVTSAELGTSADGGWSVGRRGQVRVLRRLNNPRSLPPAAVEEEALTVIDSGAPGTARPPWLREWLTRPGPTVLVTTATTYGLRHLEAVAATVPDPSTVMVAVRGPALRRWPKGLALGAAAVAARTTGRLVAIPDDGSLSWAGLETRPVPTGLLSAAHTLHTHLLSATSIGDPQ